MLEVPIRLRRLLLWPWQWVFALALAMTIASAWRSVQEIPSVAREGGLTLTALSAPLHALNSLMLVARIYVGNTGLFAQLRRRACSRGDNWWLILHGLVLAALPFLAADSTAYFGGVGTLMLCNTIWLELRRSRLVDQMCSPRALRIRARERVRPAYDALTLWVRNNIVHIVIGLAVVVYLRDNEYLVLALQGVLFSNNVIDLGAVSEPYTKAMAQSPD
ncbi:MAG: hypothetical protein ACKVW3_14500 [Phycisphaerales bacterium]